MKATIIQAIFGFALISILVHCGKNDRPWQLDSPDGRVRIEVSRQKLMSSQRLFYKVAGLDRGDHSSHRPGASAGHGRCFLDQTGN